MVSNRNNMIRKIIRVNKNEDWGDLGLSFLLILILEFILMVLYTEIFIRLFLIIFARILTISYIIYKYIKNVMLHKHSQNNPIAYDPTPMFSSLL